ncbi:MAG: hypothetical protein WAN57_00330 [Smithella sp.]
MKEIVGAKIIGDLRVRMDKDAAEKKCSMSELIRQKIIFAYEQEGKEEMIIDLKKIEGDLKSLISLLVMTSALIGEDIRQEKGMDAWEERFKNAKKLLDDYRKTGEVVM